MRRAATTIRRRSSRPSGHGFGSLVLLLTGALCLLGAGAPASPAAAATLDWSTVVWNDGDLTNTYTVGGVDVRITVSTSREPIVGCAFAPRCRLATDRCRRQAPPLEVKRPGHAAACWESEALEAAHV